MTPNTTRRLLQAGIVAVAGTIASIVVPSTPALAQMATCPDNMKSYSSLRNGEALRCVCRPNQMRRGSVWGTRRYTADSSVCRAARHAGAVGPAGGPVAVYRGGGCTSFVGTPRNGVNSGRWGNFGRTFQFRFPVPACAGGVVAVRSCPRSMAAFRALPPGQAIRCRCTPSQFRGSIWGSGRYTADSSTCGAARHAGAIGPNGGVVRVITAPGCRRFFGSVRNGIRTGNWAAYGRTFAFNGRIPRCVQ